MKKRNILTGILPLTVLCVAFMAGQNPASAAIEPNFADNVGHFDSGVIDTTNLMQLKEYEFKASEERKEQHKESGEITMNKELKNQVDQLPNKEASFILNSITFKGYTAFTEEELMNLICDKIGTRVTVGDLVGITNMVTEFYQKHGYISSVAYLAPQRVQDGNIVINIMEGRYGNVQVSGNKWNRTSYINNQYLKDKYIEPNALLNVNDIKESLTEINASGYMKGSISLEDNEESAELTDLELTIKDRFPLDFDFRWDDMGTTTTGLNRAIFFAGFYNLTGFGDQLYSTTTLARHSIGQGVMYSVPLTATKETKLNVGYSFSGADIAGQFKQFDMYSQSHNLFFTLSRRLIKTDNYKLYGDVGLDIRNTKTSSSVLPILDYKYRSRTVKANLSSIKDDFYGKWFANAGTSIGLNWFGATNYMNGRGVGLNHANPSNRGIALNGNLARIQVLPFRSTGILQAKGQWANRHLLPSERMSIGGMSSVRGYEESTYIGDYGITASAELRFPVPFLRAILPEKLKFVDDSIRLAGFYDVGWFGDRHTHGTGYPDYLMSVGGGVILKLTRYLSANVYIGVPIGNKPDGASNLRCHFVVTSNIL